MSTRLHLPLISVALLCAGITFCFAPGHMDADVLGMLNFIRTGSYTDWYPLLLAALLKIFLVLRIGPVGVLALQVFAIGLCTYSIAAFFSSPSIAAVLSYGVLLCPAVLGYLGALTSHGLVTAFVLSGCAALLYANRAITPKGRLWWFAVSFLALSLATISRFNAPEFILPIFAVWAWLLARNFGLFPSHEVVRRVVAAIAGIAITLGVSFAGHGLLLSIFKPVRLPTVQALIIYDVAAISLRANRVFFDPTRFPSQKLSDLRRIFVKNSPDPLFWGDGSVPRVRLDSDFHAQDELIRTWRGCIAMYPAYYITERWQLLRGLLGLDFKQPEAVPFHPGIDRNTLGYHIEHPAEDSLVVRYLTAFQESFVDRPFVYFLLLFAALTPMALLPSHRSDGHLVLLALAAGSFLYMAGHFVFGPSTLLRYLWPCIVANMVVASAIAAAYVKLALARRKPLKISDRFQPEPDDKISESLLRR